MQDTLATTSTSLRWQRMGRRCRSLSISSLTEVLLDVGIVEGMYASGW